MKVGILGGGQLARMMALSCHSLGIEPYIVNDKLDCPSKGLSNLLVTEYLELDKISSFLSNCEAITYEFENIPLELVEALSKSNIPLYPGVKALSTTRERIREKSFARDIGIPVPNFIYADEPKDLLSKSSNFNFPGIIKTNSSGYDGKGQWSVDSYSHFESILADITNCPLILEEKIKFDKEFSLIGVRDRLGNIQFYNPCENTHSQGILIKTRVGTIPNDSSAFSQASGYVRLLLEALDYVGVLSVEFFQVGDYLMFNEYAPRVHNSGHWSIEGAYTSQFENHIRAICGLPLGSTELIKPSLMLNLLGTKGNEIELLKYPNLNYHWYAKSEISGRRKVGHITVLGEDNSSLDAAEKVLLPLIC
jgi:5-(carboxyamino)imidazole ribonucleotide synthase